MEYTFNQGSIWRRWDLHVHTKGTNKNDQYKSRTFDDFCELLFKRALEFKIAAIGITDYFSVENYINAKKYQDNIQQRSQFSLEEQRRIKSILLIPNVELRMTPVTKPGKLINIHCLFNPSYLSFLDNDFFNALDFSIGGFKYKMNRQGFIDLGKRENSQYDEDKAYKFGVNNFIVSQEQLQSILSGNQRFRDNVIIVVSNSNSDGASGLQEHYKLFENEQDSSLDALRQAIYCLSDCVFSSNKNDRDFFLGLRTSQNDVIKRCGSLKPCIHGCDAHTEDKLFVPDNNRFCWIKSDVSFEGLKQIIYEPQERVVIDEHCPDEKIKYNIWELILLFFAFAFIGYLWEVILHLFSDGVFVNRGSLYGPWLPIYGCGGVLTLVLLNKYRDNPTLVFFASVILCGIVEYFSSLFMELAFNTRWWDYTGYFFNINGRVCLEGLLFFGFGCTVSIYIVTPLLLDLFHKLDKNYVKFLTIMLSVLFLTDFVFYLTIGPNKGNGITSYDGYTDTINVKFDKLL